MAKEAHVKHLIMLAVLLQIILRPCKCLCYRSYKRLLMFTVFAAFMIILLNRLSREPDYPSVTAQPPDIAEIMQKAKEPAKEEPGQSEGSPFEESLQRIPKNFVQLSKCPSCLGWDLCNAIDAGTLRINIPEKPTNMSRKGMYFGLKRNALVLIKVYADDREFRKYDEYVCKDAVGSADCAVGKDILRSFVVKDETYLPRNMKKAFSIVHKQPEDLSNVICVTESMLDNFIEAIDPGPGDVGPDDRALLYTSTVVHPEVVNFRFLSRTEVAWAFPHFVGACGRLIVLDHFGKPLISFSDEPWDIRADLALQILHIIDAFIKGDEAWFIMYYGFDFENFHVTDDYRVVVVNAHHIGFVDRDAAGEADPADDGKACNEECFEKYLHELYDINMPLQEMTCNKATYIMSNYMYSLACRDILSDLPQHKHTTDRAPGKKHPGKGLLHDIPVAHYEALNEALMECVTESQPNGRHQAVEELLEILNHYSEDAKQMDFALPGQNKKIKAKKLDML